MKKLIFAMVVAAVAALAACSNNSGSNNATCGTSGTVSCNNSCGNPALGYNSAYGPYQMIGSQCTDTIHNTVVQPQYCQGQQPGYNGNGGIYNQYGANSSLYSPYCNQLGGYQPYYNQLGNYPTVGACGYGAMQIFDINSGATTCVPWSAYAQYAPYARPTYYQGQMFFYMYYNRGY